MIGVIADSFEHAVVREFFELFKTPWEFWRDDRPYEVVLLAGEGNLPESTARLVLVYAGHKLQRDDEDEIQVISERKVSRILLYEGNRLPIYTGSVTFHGREAVALTDADSRQTAIHLEHSGETVLARIGYDLFREIRVLLTEGQTAVHADCPTLELHIALLRSLIIGSGVELLEIPPVPEGYRFIACLTHDVDHPSIRLHKCDHTVLGFLYRAVFGSLIRVFRGRLPVRMVWENWSAAWKLPLIHLSLARDYWSEFVRYPMLEGGIRSSFFVIPFRSDSGSSNGHPAPIARASGYGAVDIRGQIRILMAQGCEIGLHGIDAWCDSSKGRQELTEIRRITGAQAIGVRMHWLYFSQRSPVLLEEAGADYDSTVGYNQTVGYRAGTSQVYRPLGAIRLLELPLHIMDTALFFPSHLDLSPKQAGKLVDKLIDNAIQFGGAITVNWHDRSIAPERCWGDFYMDLVESLKTKGAWFATAAETVSWFRKRRGAAFEDVGCGPDELRVKNTIETSDDLPGLHVQVHKDVPEQQLLSATTSAKREMI